MSKSGDELSVFEAVITDNDNESNPTSSPPKSNRKNWREILMLSFTSLGAIYGDLGTSPLYTLNTVKYSSYPPNQEDLYGAVSIIFYLFTIIVIFKYVLLVLWLGPNNGEGGQVAIYSKIARYLHIGPKHVDIPGSKQISDSTLIRKTRTVSSFSSYHCQTIKYHPKLISVVKWTILTLCFLGCSLVISDGILTPTTSVLSAIGGIQIAQPDFNSVLAVSEVILVVLFLIQQFGSHKISFTFAPILFIWLIGIFICGLYNIIVHHPLIFKALSPYYAIKLLKNGGIDVFSGAMLSLTGTEAMFADIGHFGKLPIQLTLATFVYPCLIICYMGQGAYLINHPADYVNPFFYSIPGGANSAIFWIMFVLATLATIIASQSLILAVSSIISQLINLDCFPKLRIVHTSKVYMGKVYIPIVNWVLMIVVLATTAGFKNSNNVTAAFGLGVSIDFIVTTLLLAIAMIYVFNFNIIFPIIFILIFVPLEASIVIANLKKVPHGAWFPLMVTCTFFLFLSIWRWGRSAKITQEVKTRIKVTDMYPNLKQKPQAMELDLNGNENPNDDVASLDSETDKNLEMVDNDLVVDSYFGNYKLLRTEGIAMMYNDAAKFNLNSPNTLPMIYSKLVKEFPCLPSVFIFVTFKTLSIPTVPDEERVLIGATRIPGHYKCIVRFGFTENNTVTKALNDHILNSIPEIEDLKQKYGANDKIPLMHIFEDNLIKCHDYSHPDYKTKNPFIHIFRFCRKHLINEFFSPLHSVTQSNYGSFKLDSEMDESEKKLFVGSLIEI